MLDHLINFCNREGGKIIDHDDSLLHKEGAHQRIESNTSEACGESSLVSHGEGREDEGKRFVSSQKRVSLQKSEG